jgi:hypothetical protein
MGRFETSWLARRENLADLTDLAGQWIDQVAKRRSGKRIVLDMDSSVSPTHDDQESSVWNGHVIALRRPDSGRSRGSADSHRNDRGPKNHAGLPRNLAEGFWPAKNGDGGNAQRPLRLG